MREKNGQVPRLPLDTRFALCFTRRLPLASARSDGHELGIYHGRVSDAGRAPRAVARPSKSTLNRLSRTNNCLPSTALIYTTPLDGRALNELNRNLMKWRRVTQPT